MSINQGTNIIAGIGRSLEKNANNLLEARWFDHIVNNIEWLRSDTFSWQDGTVYASAYNHLSADISGKTLQSETIGAVTVQFYLADDGHKICPASEESNVASIYTNTGVAWYYILDTTNTRFKLPRSTYNRYSKELPVKGNGMTLGLTNGVNDGGLASGSSDDYFAVTTSAYGVTPQSSGQLSGDRLKNSSFGVTTDTTKSGIIASSVADSDMYLYFYVGEFSQTATEQTAGLNAELLNNKADKDEVWTPSSSTQAQKETIVGWGMPDYNSGITATQGTTYTAQNNCWLYAEVYSTSSSGGGDVTKAIEINGIEVAKIGSFHFNRGLILLPCKKGDTYQFKNVNTGSGSYVFKVFPTIGG